MQMDTFGAFAMGEANRGRESMVFDWEKAAYLIKKYKVQEASAGLAGDWGCTGGDIFRDNKPITSRDDTYVYLASTWATPELCINDEYFDCYRMQSEVPNWDAHTLWPQEALDILNGTRIYQSSDEKELSLSPGQ
jgi:hypothetical protein